jgi:nucleoside-diphosphate-sugar epimerase
VVVTGGAGFIGSELLPILAASHEVISLERPRVNNNIRTDKTHTTEYCDITNPDEVTKIIKKLQPEILIHLAALSSVANSYANPNNYVQTNLLGTINLAEACTRQVGRFKKMIFASSIHVYKDTPNILQTEEKL